MSETRAHDIQKEVRIYILVFVSLAALTVITVAISYLHLKIYLAIMIALCVATIKGSLVGCYFMHLISERRLVYTVLTLTGIFFIVIFALPLLGFYDPLNGTQRSPYVDITDHAVQKEHGQ